MSAMWEFEAKQKAGVPYLRQQPGCPAQWVVPEVAKPVAAVAKPVAAVAKPVAVVAPPQHDERHRRDDVPVVEEAPKPKVRRKKKSD